MNHVHMVTLCDAGKVPRLECLLHIKLKDNSNLLMGVLGKTFIFVCFFPPQAVLSNSKHLDKSYPYRFLHPWLGTGLLTRYRHKWSDCLMGMAQILCWIY